MSAIEEQFSFFRPVFDSVQKATRACVCLCVCVCVCVCTLCSKTD